MIKYIRKKTINDNFMKFLRVSINIRNYHVKKLQSRNDGNSTAINKILILLISHISFKKF